MGERNRTSDQFRDRFEHAESPEEAPARCTWSRRSHVVARLRFGGSGTAYATPCSHCFAMSAGPAMMLKGTRCLSCPSTRATIT